ncbi:LamG domain-containing protein, partial [bacterium]|nr:LamG domain-containing protein [bacterium]
FDENTSGNASGQTLWDDSDHDNDGTGYGTDGPVWTTGKLNSALEFDGNDDHVSVSNYSELADILHNHFTYSFWVKYNGPSSSAKWPYLLGPTDTHKYPGVRGGGNYGANPPYLEWGLYPVCDGSSYTALAVPSETDGEWHHIAFTYDGSVAKAYFDGEYYAQKSQDGMCPGFNNFIIGKQYNGLIDDVRIYNYARTPAQILEDYNAGAIRIGASN